MIARKDLCVPTLAQGDRRFQAVLRASFFVTSEKFPESRPCLDRLPLISVMRHLTNPDGSAKTPHIERQEKPEWTAVSEDARQLIGQSIAGNTRAACVSALARLDAALGRDRPLDAGIADYLASLYRDGKSPATIALVVAAIQFRTKIAGTRSPVGEVTRRTLAGIRKDGRERGRGRPERSPMTRSSGCRPSPPSRAMKPGSGSVSLARTKASTCPMRP